MSNLSFHRVRIGGLEFEALMSVDGPYLAVRGHDGRRYEGGWPWASAAFIGLGRRPPGSRAPRGRGGTS